MIAELNAGLQTAILLALGYGSRRLSVVDAGFPGALSKLLIAFFLPCVILKALLTGGGDSGASAFLWAFAAVGVIVAMGLALSFVFSRLTKRKDGFHRVLTAAMLFTNFTFMGFPVTEALYGAAGIYCVSLMSIPMRLILYTSLPLIYAKGEKRPAVEYLKLLLSPPILSVIVGLVLSGLNIRLWTPVENVVGVMASACTPLGMMLCGMLVAEVPMKAFLGDGRILLTSALRLVVMPALVLLALCLLPMPRMQRDVAVIFTALPVASIVSAFAARENVHATDTAAVIVMSTVFSLVTVPVWAWILTML